MKTQHTARPVAFARLSLFLVAGALLSCDSQAGLGEKGGECRLGRPACNDALICYEGKCKDAEDVPPVPITEEDFTATIDLTKTTMKADGQDSVIFAFDLLDRKTGQPTTLPGVLVRTHPINAGRVNPAKLPLEKGHGVVEIKACNTEYADCPSSFRIVLVTLEYPTVPILQSPVITYEGIRPPDTGAGGNAAAGGAGGGDGAAGGGGAAGAGGAAPETELTPGEVEGGMAAMTSMLSGCSTLDPNDPNVPPNQIAICESCMKVMRGEEEGILLYADGAGPTMRTVTLKLHQFLDVDGALFPHVAEFTGGGMTFAIPFGRGGYRDSCDQQIDVTGDTAVLSAAAGCNVNGLGNCGPKMGGRYQGSLELLGYLTSGSLVENGCGLVFKACINTFGNILPAAP